MEIKLADSDGVDAFEELAATFMKDIFELDSGQYLITDESSLYDFMSLDLSGAGNHQPIQEVEEKITRLYGIEPVPFNLLEIFRLLSRAGKQ